ncbi:MAG: hypothetical protein RQ729_10315 [Wenzhouxiangellaceae bacterium]|nr:hypothetical protein [Wenzhouxiangellaceae bacterium]
MNRWILALLALLMLAACGSGPTRVRSEPPGLLLDLLALEGNQARIVVLLHNRNDHALAVSAIELRMLFDDEVLFEQPWTVNLMMDARGRERVVLETTVRASAAKRLTALESGDQPSLRYQLQGGLELADQRDMPLDRTGFLHPVPGQPGQFR